MTGVSAFLLIALAGAGLAHWSSPGVFRLAAGSTASVVRTFGGRLQLSNPEGLAFWTFIVSAVLLFVPAISHLLVVLVGVVAYLLASAVMLMVGPRWWYRLLFTVVASLVVVFGLVAIAEALQPHSIGEGGLAILGPMMFSWAVLPALVLLRVLFRSMRASAE